ncbi:hypothetical protein GIB67_016470 [Kingdonia uniflora]|uniref:rhamnogalacturonan endolyase n=1 Tax=Kingdonia uniflora TaxID=39325 RepID=A0A7J7M817_9MAGN|nr:hypothetical protein GIB67_016470 [Kingdonia uniflora]
MHILLCYGHLLSINIKIFLLLFLITGNIIIYLQIVMDNGLVKVTLSNPGGMVTGVQYNGIENLLEFQNEEENRGYWDLNWGRPEQLHARNYDRIVGTNFTVIVEDSDQVELSFTRTWDSSPEGNHVPLNIDKRYILLRGCPGFYSYGIYGHLEGWPDFNLAETRTVFKLSKDKFHYMAISDTRQRIMPMPEDRATGQPLAYPEAILLTNPINFDLTGEVDDKYQYSCHNKDNGVHGWICSDPLVGFWMITPSNEFRTGGPLRQDLTSHVGPTTLAMFVSEHYSGENVELKFREGEPWKKVFGPVLIYLNSIPGEVDRYDMDPYTILWEDAKEQLNIEVQSWPYSFPTSEDYPYSYQRGTASGRLLVQDRYISEFNISGNAAYVGLASPGEVGSWQSEGKAYQFWTRADAKGYFCIRNIRPGDYNLFAWVPGFVGEYKFDDQLAIKPGSDIRLGFLVYEPPRDGPTLWEIGIPDRSAAEFYVPDPDPNFINKLYVNHPDRFRQYGLWERYADLYPDGDLVYMVGVDDYKNDWFFSQVTRRISDKTYQATTWQIIFELTNINYRGTYKLRLALASAAMAELQVRFNDSTADPSHFTTGLIGTDNTIARHGIHGLSWFYNIDVPGYLLVDGANIIFLTQSRSLSPFQGVMYDYIRFEGVSDD